MTAAKWISHLFNKRRTPAARHPMPLRGSGARPILEVLEDRLVPAPLLVTSVADSGVGSLRAAINAANRMSGVVTINFAIGAPGNARIINLTSPLPTITGSVFLNGPSQGGPGYSGPPLIELNGTNAGPNASGLDVTGNSSTIVGLMIDHFAQDGIVLRNSAANNTIGGTTAANVISGNGNDGIELVNPGTANNLIEGNLIGTTAAGNGVFGNKVDGIVIRTGANNNTVGGTAAGARNLISANGNDGIEIINPATTTNLIAGNLIGTNLAGTTAFGNGHDGIVIRTGAGSNTVGGAVSGAGNVISGNGNDGMELVDSGTTNNLVQGNLIGTNPNGNAPIGNKFDGIVIRAGASRNTIGGTASAAGNVISFNGDHGIEILDSATASNLVQGNFIGTNPGGTSPEGNKFDGIVIRGGAGSNTIGGTASGAGNVISANGNDGVEIINKGTTGNLLQGNLIGTNLAGTGAIANKFDGIVIRTGASNNTVGGTVSGAGNVISGNGNDGVEIVGTDTSGNLVQGNNIGVQSDAASGLGNGANGVAVRDHAKNNTIGGTATGAGNIIAFNKGDGVLVGDTTQGIVAGTGNAIEGNSIYLNQRLGIFLGFDDTSKPPIILVNDSLGHPDFNNRYQNYPVLNTPQLTPNTSILSGTISSPNTPRTAIRIELFVSSNAVAVGRGQGAVFLGFVTVTTNAAGQASFSLTVPTVLIHSQVVSATATDAAGNTSEFSRDVVVP
jgi:hypothetical protein